MSNKMKRSLSLFFLVVGLAGTVVFFPFNFNDRYPCLYQRMFCRQEQVATVQHQLHEQTTDEKTMPEQQAGHMHHANALIPHYLKNYASYWWGSMLLVGLCLFLFRKKRESHLNTDTSAPALAEDRINKSN